MPSGSRAFSCVTTVPARAAFCTVRLDEMADGGNTGGSFTSCTETATGAVATAPALSHTFTKNEYEGVVSKSKLGVVVKRVPSPGRAENGTVAATEATENVAVSPRSCTKSGEGAGVKGKSSDRCERAGHGDSEGRVIRHDIDHANPLATRRLSSNNKLALRPPDR